MTNTWLFIGLLGVCECSHGQPVLERVVDGDTVIIRDQAQSYPVRLLDIDAPELHQSFGKQARRSLSDLCTGTSIAVKPQGHDPYGRTLAHVYCADVDASQSQIALGMAWFNQRYSKRTALAVLQQQAQQQGVGLWQEASPMPPWQWRKRYGQYYRRQP